MQENPWKYKVFHCFKSYLVSSFISIFIGILHRPIGSKLARLSIFGGRCKCKQIPLCNFSWYEMIGKVVRLIRANLGTNEFSLNEVFYNHFQRLTILFIHCQKEQRQHDDHHGQCCKAHISGCFYQKENRHSYRMCSTFSFINRLRTISAGRSSAPMRINGRFVQTVSTINSRMLSSISES